MLAELGRALDFDKNRHIQEAYEAGLVASNYPRLDPAQQLRRRCPACSGASTCYEIAESADRDRLPRGLGEPHARRRPRAAGPRVRRARAARAGRQRRARLGGDDHPQRDHAQRRDHQGPVERSAHRDRDRAHARRRRARTTRSRSTSRSPTGRAATPQIEEQLYRPEKIEKIVAWGGFASVKHVTRYLQPGLELIALDPKRSATIIGPEAFESEETLREVALRAAVRHRRREPGGLRVRARDLRAVRHRRGGHRARPTGSARRSTRR